MWAGLPPSYAFWAILAERNLGFILFYFLFFIFFIFYYYFFLNPCFPCNKIFISQEKIKKKDLGGESIGVYVFEDEGTEKFAD